MKLLSLLIASYCSLTIAVNVVRKKERDTQKGRVKGNVIALGIRGLPQVEVYLGIPYGAPPERTNRFMPPQGTPGWQHIKDATSFKPACIQNFPDISNEQAALSRMPRKRYQYLKRLLPFLKLQSENCLYMNLYVPQVNVNPSSLLPILVLVHGESFDWDSGNAYDGSVLAAHGQIIVVTLNYRLGALGFLSTGQDMHRLVGGNFALTDVIAAVEMLREIAADFGGDKDRITLLGVSYGAAIVHLLTASHFSMAQDVQKFRRAILLGGSAFSKWAVTQTPNQYFYLFAQKLGCETIENDGKYSGYKTVKSTTDVFACIKAQSVENITAAQSKMPNPEYLSTFGPVVDGITVNRHLESHLESHPNYFHRYDLLIGLTQAPAFQHFPNDYIQNGMVASERELMLRTLVRNLYSWHRALILDAIENHYTDWTNPQMHEGTIRKKTIQALSDSLYVAPLLKAARLHAQRDVYSEASSGTYMYVFEGNQQDGYETVSTEDLPYILGYPLLTPGMLDVPHELNYTRMDHPLSEILMIYIANFVKSGNPNVPDDFSKSRFLTQDSSIPERFQRASPWPRFISAQGKEQYMVVGEQPKTDAFYEATDVAFWNELVPRLNHRGNAAVDEDERHHFLPDHLNQAKYFGEVYPYRGYFTTPPPPPMPTPPPAITPELATIIAKKRKAKESMQADDAAKKEGEEAKVKPAGKDKLNSTILSITVAVGCAFLILNILVLTGIYHQRQKQHKQRAKYAAPPQYNSYEAQTVSPYVNLNSPIAATAGASSHLPPPPPPPGAINTGNMGAGTGGHRDGDLHPQLTHPGSMRTFHDPGTAGGGTHNHFPEQEPLLRGTGICPRHGKPTSSGARATGPMEEIQV